MSTRRPPFLLLVALLLPALFFAWWGTAPWVARGEAWLLETLRPVLFPTTVVKILPAGRKVAILTLGQWPGSGRDLRRGLAIDPARLSFGLPLFFALATFSRAGPWQQVWRMTLGGIILLIGVGLSLVSMIYYQLAFDPALRASWAAPSALTMGWLIASAYRFGVLFLPVLLPLLLWAGLYRETSTALLTHGRVAAT